MDSCVVSNWLTSHYNPEMSSFLKINSYLWIILSVSYDKFYTLPTVSIAMLILYTSYPLNWSLTEPFSVPNYYVRTVTPNIVRQPRCLNKPNLYHQSIQQVNIFRSVCWCNSMFNSTKGLSPEWSLVHRFGTAMQNSSYIQLWEMFFSWNEMVVEKKDFFIFQMNSKSNLTINIYFTQTQFWASLYKLFYCVLLRFKWQVSQLTDTTAVPTVDTTTVPLITWNCSLNVCYRCIFLCTQRKSNFQENAPVL